jgi:hypothetical protein
LLLNFTIKYVILKIKENQNGLSLCGIVRMDEWSVLTKTFVPKREAITEGWRKFKNVKIMIFYSSTNIINSVELVRLNTRH